MPIGRSPLGVGGGEAIKQSVSRPMVRAYLETIGGHLGWHGALSVDVIMPDDGTAPLLIDCNPRLVEPINAYRAGIDLVGLLLRVSQGETPARIAGKPRGRAHASGDAGAARLRIARRHAGRYYQGMRAGVYRQRTLRRQPRRTHAGAAGLVQRGAAGDDGSISAGLAESAIKLARGGFGAHLLDLGSIRKIESEGFC